MSKNHDPQQQKAYDWEDSFTLWAGAHVEPPQARRIVAAACHKYRVPVPKLTFARIDKRAGTWLRSLYDPNDHSILIRPRHMNASVLLHESAHAITDWILGYDLEAHGPEWLGVFMVLLEDFDIAPRSALHASADDAGLRYRPRHLVAPGVIRRRHRRKVRQARRDR